MGTLNLYLRMLGSLQKELAQSDNVGLRKRPKCDITLELIMSAQTIHFRRFLSRT